MSADSLLLKINSRIRKVFDFAELGVFSGAFLGSSELLANFGLRKNARFLRVSRIANLHKNVHISLIRPSGVRLTPRYHGSRRNLGAFLLAGAAR